MSNLQRAYLIGKTKWLDLSLSFHDVVYLIKCCKDPSLQSILQETIDEAGEDLRRDKSKLMFD